MTHPHSIFIWHPSHYGGRWVEPAQVYTQEYALYLAHLIHQDSKAVIKVVRYGLNIACFPNDHTVKLVEQQIAREKKHFMMPELPLFYLFR